VRKLSKRVGGAGGHGEHATQQMALSAADVRERTESREIIGREDPRLLAVGLGRHRRIQEPDLVGMIGKILEQLGKILEQPAGDDGVGGGRSGSRRVFERAPKDLQTAGCPSLCTNGRAIADDPCAATSRPRCA
jgi:hypothetical protein